VVYLPHLIELGEVCLAIFCFVFGLFKPSILFGSLATAFLVVSRDSLGRDFVGAMVLKEDLGGVVEFRHVGIGVFLQDALVKLVEAVFLGHIRLPVGMSFAFAELGDLGHCCLVLFWYLSLIFIIKKIQLVFIEKRLIYNLN